MTSHKLFLTLVVLVVVSSTGNALHDSFHDRRVRRSDGVTEQSEASPTEIDEDHGFRAGYRFGEEFFLPQASKFIPAKYKKKADGCERVVKNSMVCMVCRDPKTNAKYEQCSYVGNPKTAPSRQSNNDYKVPNVRESSVESAESSAAPPYESPELSGSVYGNSKASEAEEPTGYGYKEYAQAPHSYSENSNEETENSEIPAESTNCREVENGSKTCRICKDPKTGKDLERCSTSYQPDADSYAYGETDKYGYPESREYDGDEKSDYKSYDGNGGSSEDQAETTDCHQIKKNDQICTVCKDPKTGGDSERCGSSYSPADKSYAYGTSETYGAPAAYGNEGNDDKSGKEEDDDKTTDAGYDSPSEYQTEYSKANDDNYEKYSTDRPEDYERSSYDNDSDKAEYGAPSSPVASTKSVKNGGKNGCYKVQKDSTSCTVCTDPKTGGNFEKCSYAYKPNDKIYKYTNSKTSGYPETVKDGETSSKIKKTDRRSADSPSQSETKRIVNAVKTGCEKIQKDSMICNVCKDPETGARSEQCAYGSKPLEKSFSYVASKSLGNPREKGEQNGDETDREERQESRQVPLRYGKQNRQFVGEIKSATDAIGTSDCREIKKDFKICNVCKDPKTGTSSERCSYASKPKKNSYAYGKSEFSGNPKKSGKGRREGIKDEEIQEPRETQLNVETVEGSGPCRKIERDSMTCTICKDPKTGGNSEQCAYSYKPKDRHFTYSKSKSFGNPRKKAEEGDKE